MKKVICLGLMAAAPAFACPNFSGDWRGKCADGGEPRTVIRQEGCKTIVVDGQVYGIGGVKSTTTSYAPETGVVDNVVTTTAWSDDGATLVWHSTYVGKTKAVEPVTRTSRATVRLASAKLVVDGDVAGKKVSCTYEKR